MLPPIIWLPSLILGVCGLVGGILGGRYAFRNIRESNRGSQENTTITAMNSRIGAADTNFLSAVDKINLLTEKVGTLTQRQIATDEEVSRLRRQLAEVQTDNAVLSDQNRTQQDANVILTEENRQLKGRLALVEQECRQLKSAYDALDAAVAAQGSGA